MKEINSIHKVELDDFEKGGEGSKIISDNKLDYIKDVKVQLKVEIGETSLSVGELFALRRNEVLKLDTACSAPIRLSLNGKTVAKGNLVVVDDNFGIEITDTMES